MSKKVNSNEPVINNAPVPSAFDELKEHKENENKFNHDLYHEENDIVQKIFRVKKIKVPNNGIKWKIMDDNKVIFTIESEKLSKKEKAFLQTVDGFNFILNRAKIGIKNLNNFKTELKKIINNN